MSRPQTATSLQWLQEWFRSHCNGEWEHQNGVKIESLDNPGWGLVVDLHGTELDSHIAEPYAVERDEHDWVFCKIEAGQFRGHGDPSKLEWMIEYFRRWVETESTRSGKIGSA